jgi:VanZ family protein
MKKIIWHTLSVLAALGIFLSSALSGEVSGYASMTIARLLPDFIPLDNSVANFLVRKTAHFTVYFVLAFCLANSLKFYIQKYKPLFLSAWATAALYGVTDEIHQHFVPGRVMSPADIAINAAGALAGAAFVVYWLYRKYKTRPA